MHPVPHFPLLRRVLLVLFAAAVLAASWGLKPDVAARAQVQQGLTRALASFAVVRAVGGALAMASGTGVTVQPLGVGVALAPGRVLEPLKEMAEQVAALLLAASVAFGIQLVLLSIGAHPAVALALSAAALVWVLASWRSGPVAGRIARAVAPLLMLLLMARFAVPLAAVGSETVFRAVMAGDHQEAVATIGRSGTELEDARAAVAAPRGAESENWLERLRRKLPSVPDPAAAFERMKQSAEAAVAKMVRLAAIFAVQTVLLPLAFLWMLARIVRMALGAGSAQRQPAPDAAR